jgi:hypothetical protein
MPVPAAEPSRAQPEERGEKPEPGMVKLNVHGSFLAQDGTIGAGMILRDSKGKIIFSACLSRYHCISALEAELGACMQGISLAI